MIAKWLWLAGAGALGTLARFGLSGWVQRHAGAGFPWGTVVVNLTGCLIFGLAWSAMENRLALSGEIRIIVLAGFMGAFTTFSTFMYETSALVRDSEWLLAAANLIGQNGLGIVFLLLGLAIGRLI